MFAYMQRVASGFAGIKRALFDPKPCSAQRVAQHKGPGAQLQDLLNNGLWKGVNTASDSRRTIGNVWLALNGAACTCPLKAAPERRGNSETIFIAKIDFKQAKAIYERYKLTACAN